MSISFCFLSISCSCWVFSLQTSNPISDSKALRLIDANLNRLREGIRVIEDIFRYIKDDKSIATALKEIRHRCRLENYEALLASRDIESDCLKQTTESEKGRADLDSVLLSNFKRAQESARVLEEFLKLENAEGAENFKQVRYALYALEKKALTAKRLSVKQSDRVYGL